MQSIVIASLLATAVSANVNFMANPIMKRGAIEARQTGLPSLGDISEECQSAVVEIAQGVPTPAPEIVSDLLKNPQTDPCSFSTPASLSSEYADYSSSIIAWYGKNQDDIMSAVKECPELASLASLVPVCEASATGAPASTGLTATTTGVVPPVVSSADETAKTPAATPTSGGSSPVETNGAVSREGGFFYVAAAAVAGVVAAL
ncbi:hypothetical protein HYE68_009935 [Fusarium pseudograminearum]|nr:hypothetical protein HYE68_009935 [Fusarium pseudograminearum]